MIQKTFYYNTATLEYEEPQGDLLKINADMSNVQVSVATKDDLTTPDTNGKYQVQVVFMTGRDPYSSARSRDHLIRSENAAETRSLLAWVVQKCPYMAENALSTYARWALLSEKTLHAV